jgi:Cu2+-exporting ATPase
VRVPASALAPQDRIFVPAGERIAADGVILSGGSSVDEALITGETLPRRVATGDIVYAGTINRDGALSIEVAAAADHTLASEVQKLLEKAGAARSQRTALADRAARLYAPVVHVTALVAAIGWLVAGAGLYQALLVATTVLIITCPCALALAVPAVQVVAAGALFRRGIFLNAGSAIERLAEVDTIVFDKTGTLTLPETVTIEAEGVAADLRQDAARLAQSSRHPLAAALAAEAGNAAVIADTVEVPGEGVRATVDGVEMRLGSLAFCDIPAPAGDPCVSHIGFRRGDRTAVFSVRQRLRRDAERVIAALQARGLDCRILSGDRNDAVTPIAAQLGITNYAAGVKPADKIAAIEALAADGRKVAMVGDGLNDAPALAAAHVSLSPIAAADLARAEADAVFLGEKLEPIVFAVDAARRARRLMTGNLAFSALYNLCAVPLAVFGMVTPLIAALAMSGSSLFVTLNALRARPAASKAADRPVVAEQEALAS